MSFRLLAFLARRSLFSSRATVVLLSISIAAGTGFEIANAANLDAFGAALLEEGLTHGAGDVRVEPDQDARFHDGDALAARLAAMPGVRGALPVLVYAGSVGRHGRFLGTPIYGIGPTSLAPYHVTSGAALADGDANGILLGTQLAKRLAVQIGDAVDVRVILGAPDPLLGEDNLLRLSLTVRGIVGGSAGAYRFAYVDRAFLAAQAGDAHAASAVVVHLDHHEAATATAAAIARSEPHTEAVGWREDDPYLPNYLAANRTIGTVSYAMVIAAIAVPMWALLYIHVLRRRRELGILAALGFSRGEVFAMVILQALVVAVIGCALGSLLGLGLILYFQGHPLFEWETLVVRPAIALGSFVGPIATLAATALVAGAYPAWRAARTSPAQVLRRLE